MPISAPGLRGPPIAVPLAGVAFSDRAFDASIKPKAGRPLTIRKEFPESWIWESVDLENG